MAVQGSDAWTKCPVTLETFTHPVLIECGHTFDKETIKKLHDKKCPTCNAKITGNIELYPTNWAIVSALNLHIEKKQDDNDELFSYTAEQARNDAKAIRDKKHHESLISEKKNIIKLIHENVKKGHTGFQYNFHDKDVKDDIGKWLAELKYSLNKLGGWGDKEYVINWAGDGESYQANGKEEKSNIYDSDSDDDSSSYSSSGSDVSDSDDDE